MPLDLPAFSTASNGFSSKITHHLAPLVMTFHASPCWWNVRPEPTGPIEKKASCDPMSAPVHSGASNSF